MQRSLKPRDGRHRKVVTVKNRGVSDVSPRVVQQIAENLRQVYGVTMPPQNHQTRDMDEVGDEKGIPGSPRLGKHNDGRML